MSLIVYVFSFLFGISIGSALLCAAMRFADGEAWWKGRSVCDFCKKELDWDQLVPVLSFLIYRGKCKKCKKKLNWFYLVFELIAGFAALIVIARFVEFSDYWILARDVLIVLIGLFAMGLDWYKMLVSARLMLVGSILVFLIPSSLTLVEMLVGAGIGLVFFGLQYVLTRGKGIGSGDIFLGVFMGFALGWPSVIIAIFAAYILGAGHAVYLLSKKEANRKTQLSLGLYLMIGLILTLGIQLWSLAIL